MFVFKLLGARCSSKVRAFAYGAVDHQIDRSNQCSTTGVIKAVVCAMLSVDVNIKQPCSGGSGFPLSQSEWSFTICPVLYNCKLKKCVQCVVK